MDDDIIENQDWILPDEDGEPITDEHDEPITDNKGEPITRG